MSKHRFPIVILAIAAACTVPDAPTPNWVLDPTLTPQTSNVSSLLIAISVVDRDTVWVSGTAGTYARTVDGGRTWQSGVVPGADSLQFRDVHAFDAHDALLLSIGNGDDSRIYRTRDGGATWTLQFTNPDSTGFFDTFGFWDRAQGIAFSDSHDGRLHIIRTEDGETWQRIPPDSLPPANPNEGAFAASGTNIVIMGDSTAWIGTGASPAGARVLMTTDRGRTWRVVETPIVAGTSAGIATVTFHDMTHGAVLGGDIAQPDSFTNNVALTRDGGATWMLAARPPFSGAVYGSSFTPGAPVRTLVAVGPRGVAFTSDDAATWTLLDTLNHWGVAMAAPDAGWAVGPNGRITRLQLYRDSTSAH